MHPRPSKTQRASSLLFLFVIHLLASSSLKEVAGCSCCTALEGKTYDLDPLVETSSAWQVSLPNDVRLWVNFCSAAPNTPCADSVASCVEMNGKALSAGALSSKPQWSLGPSGGVQVTYTKGSECPNNPGVQLSTVINVLCGSDDPGTFLGGELNGTCQFVLNMTSVHGCPTTASSTATSSTSETSTGGGSTGSGSATGTGGSTGATSFTSGGATTTSGDDGSEGGGMSPLLYILVGLGAVAVVLGVFWCLCCRGRCQMECPCPCLNPCCCCCGNAYVRI